MKEFILVIREIWNKEKDTWNPEFSKGVAFVIRILIDVYENSIAYNKDIQIHKLKMQQEEDGKIVLDYERKLKHKDNEINRLIRLLDKNGK